MWTKWPAFEPKNTGRSELHYRTYCTVLWTESTATKINSSVQGASTANFMGEEGELQCPAELHTGGDNVGQHHPALGPVLPATNLRPSAAAPTPWGARRRHHSRHLLREVQSREAADETAEAMAAGSGGGEALAPTMSGQHLALAGMKERQPREEEGDHRGAGGLGDGSPPIDSGRAAAHPRDMVKL